MPLTPPPPTPLAPAPPQDPQPTIPTSIPSTPNWHSTTFTIALYNHSPPPEGLQPPALPPPDLTSIHPLTSLTPHPWILPSTHATVMTHFSTSPGPSLQISYYTTEPYAHVLGHQTFFQPYCELFCTRSPILQPIFAHNGDYDHCPPAFHPLLNDLLLFYITVLTPYYTHIEQTRPWRTRRLFNKIRDDLRHTFLFLFSLFCRRRHDYDHPAAGYIPRRYNSGLLREGQVRVLEGVVRGMMVQLGELFRWEVGEVDVGKEEVRMKEAYRVWISARGMVLLLGGPGFRCERLERLVCKYLDEEEVNWGFVRKLDAVQRESDTT